MAMSEGSVAFFRRSWSVYDALVEWNYMHHREIYAAVTEWMAGHRAASGGAFLDLGCGNARIVRRCLEAVPPSSYTGVDLSAEALAEARDFLKDFPSVTLIQADLLTFLEQDDSGQFDVIFSGFAVHHLGHDAKARFFAAAAPRLKSGGALLVVDVIREGEEETREEAVAAYIQMMREAWTRLDPADLENACAHVAEHDFPESLAEWEAQASRAGFAPAECLARHGRHVAAVFTRPV